MRHNKRETKFIQKRQDGIIYSVNSWKNYFYLHTNKDAEDFKICRSKKTDIFKWEDFIPAKNEVLIGSFTLLNDWMVRFEITNALPKLFVRNLKTNEEEELIFSEEKVYNPGFSIIQRDRKVEF